MFKMNKKGQAALEFLTTYGWAFMVILVMIGALAYFGVLNPQNLIPDQCAITSGFTCKDFSLTTTSLSILGINNMGEQIDVSAFNVTKPGSGVDATCGGTTAVSAVVDGGQFTVNCTNLPGGWALTSNSKQKLGFSFDYSKQGSTFNHKVTGTLTATVR
ncbi:hypothetical protein K9L67_04460 [Candidatus Woesearchaeota archaeon]|nr:hypothetical protein [Candidatus Woesearchaeota archaeon]MCF7901452.1 hypothetical protein [Candidatus Woesearchaeota archaeon]MCF8013537.1 hypothetical protein [Candidatus Woesearchaeota archaeon]